MSVISRVARRAALLIVAGLCSSVVAGAQRPPAAAPRSATYLYLRGADTLGVETLTLSDSSVSGDLVLSGAPRIVWTHARSAAGFGALAMRVFAPGGAPNSAPMQEGTLRIDGDSARIEFSAGTRTQRQSLGTSRGAVALVNASVLHAAVIGARAVRDGQSTVNLFLSNGGQTAPSTFAMRGDTLVMSIGGSESRVLADADGLPREITIPSQGARVIRSAALVQTPGTSAIDYSAPSGAPYTAEQIAIPTGRGYSLAATLTRPVVKGRVPVVVTISGSGPQERDSRISLLPGYAPFREIADTLGRRGIATLRWDDRGVGASGGLESARTATSADFAEDVKSIVLWLALRSDIDDSRIALVGHSEGGIIAPMVASTMPNVRAIALLAGSAYTGNRVIMAQNRQAIDAMPVSQATRDSLWQSLPAQLGALATTNAWMKFFMAHDPLVTARTVQQPVLILQGDTDHQVSPEQADTLAAAFRDGGNKSVTVRRFPDTNHLFLNDPSGAFSGYGALKDTRMRREVLGTLADWLATTLK